MKHLSLFLPIILCFGTAQNMNAQGFLYGPANINQITKVESGYKYELTYNPENIVIPQEKGSYVKRLRIYNESFNWLIHEQIIYGNSLNESNEQRDSFEVIHLNFDDIADVRFSHHNQTFTNILSVKDNEGRITFYKENLLSSIREYNRDEIKHRFVGSFYDGYHETTYTLKGIYFDTLISFQQTINKPFIVQELYFLNDKGRLTNFANPNKEPAKPKLKKEFGDYNFDNYEDFRIQTADHYSEWNYFLFDSSTNAYLLDTLLSSMQFSFFDFNLNKFTGTLSTRIDDLTQQIDTYEYVEKKLTVVYRRVCRQVRPNSERSDCTIYELINGELIYTDFMRGAE